jgi:phosphate:Na+ symporter
MLPAGIAVMLGAELGTCADMLLATARANRQALKTGIFHLFFNIWTVTAGLLLYFPSVALVTRTSAGSDIKSQIANAHVLFNVFGVLTLLLSFRFLKKFQTECLPTRRSRNRNYRKPARTQAKIKDSA